MIRRFHKIEEKKPVFANDMILVKKARSKMERNLRYVSLLFINEGKPYWQMFDEYLLAGSFTGREKFINLKASIRCSK